MAPFWPGSLVEHNSWLLYTLIGLCLVTSAWAAGISNPLNRDYEQGREQNQQQNVVRQNLHQQEQQLNLQQLSENQKQNRDGKILFDPPILQSENAVGHNSHTVVGLNLQNSPALNSQNAVGQNAQNAPQGSLGQNMQLQHILGKQQQQQQQPLENNEYVQNKVLNSDQNLPKNRDSHQNLQESDIHTQGDRGKPELKVSDHVEHDYAKRLDSPTVNGVGVNKEADKPAEVNFEANNQDRSRQGVHIEVQKDKVIGRVVEPGLDSDGNLITEKVRKTDLQNSFNNLHDTGNDKGNLNNNNPHVIEGLDGRGTFDVGNTPKSQDRNNGDSLNNDLFDRKNDVHMGGIPDHVKIIDGEVEKLKIPENNIIESHIYPSLSNGQGMLNRETIKIPSLNSNEIPRNVDTKRNAAVDVGNNNVITSEDEKPGSLKVVWDWSDFAVNFEQYVMPEQKIRRAPHATTGEPWPMPQYYVSKKDKVYRIDKANFRFDISKIKCDIIEKAIERYKPYVLEDPVEDMYDNFQHAQSTMFEEPSTKYETPMFLEAPAVSRVLIKIRKPCAKLPSAKSDESYDLFVKRTGVHIWANEVWGALRGLETLSQLVFKGSNQMLYIRDTVINDYPRFSHRGLLIDSSRHFIFKETIYDVLEGMAQNKMNVLHWHIVDDQSFPFYSNAYPDLSAKGAFHPSFVYMPEDVADIIEYARLRGIRVQPEFDTPGHTYSWGLSRPDLLTQCYQGDRPVDGYLGPMDPSKNETFRFLKNFFKDVLHSFKDQYLHLGGDEVPMTCWQSNQEITKFLSKLEGKPESETRNTDPYYYSYDIRKVLEYYVTRVIKDLKSLAAKRPNGLRLVFWQEIMNNNVQLPNDTIIQVWQGGMEEVERAISLGLNVIYSTCWYLDLIEYGTKWSKYYQCDPADATYGFNIDESKVLGGEACLWAEYIDNENLMTTLWPRASATAERLWSSKDVRDLDSAAARLQEHRCRMLSRGLGVGQISGPDYCLRRGKRRHNANETSSSSNCTYTQCAAFADKGRVEVENIKVEFEQKGGHISDCSQAVLHAGGQLTLITILLILAAIAVTLTFTKKKIAPVRMCKNKSILMVFITLILVYFMCYTTIWMQAMEFKGSFEKRISSNVHT